MKTSSLPIYANARVLLQAARSLDKRFRVTSLYRSRASQQKLYTSWLRRGRTGLPVAPPGHSMHELGQAVDIARGVDPFKDDDLAELGEWWRSYGLGWSPSDPVHFQLQPIPVHAAGAASGERHDLRAPMAAGTVDMPVHHPAVTRGLTSEDPPDYPVLPGSVRLGPGTMAADPVQSIASSTVKGAAAAALAAFGAGGGVSGALAAAQSVLAVAPEAVPVAAAGIIASIVLPAIASGEMFSNKIDPYFDATTPEAIARSRRQAALIKADLQTTGVKFSRRGQSDKETL